MRTCGLSTGSLSLCGKGQRAGNHLKQWMVESILCVKLSPYSLSIISLKKLSFEKPPLQPSRSAPALWALSFLQMDPWPESHRTLYTAVFIVYPLIHSWGRGESNKRQYVEGDIFCLRFLLKLDASVAKIEALLSSTPTCFNNTEKRRPSWQRDYQQQMVLIGDIGHFLLLLLRGKKGTAWERWSPVPSPTCRFSRSSDLFETVGDKVDLRENPEPK